MVDQAEIHRKAIGCEYEECREALNQLLINFAILPDKEQAWEDLHRLTLDEDSDVRRGVTCECLFIFPQVLDKEQAWKDVILLMQDEDTFVRSSVAYAFGSAYPHVPDKEQVWKDLIRRTQDEDISVRMYANHSLGRISIFKATGAENDEKFRKELKKALEFFEKSSTEEPFNPSKFCFPFYRSFYTIAF